MITGVRPGLDIKPNARLTLASQTAFSAAWHSN